MHKKSFESAVRFLRALAAAIFAGQLLICAAYAQSEAPAAAVARASKLMKENRVADAYALLAPLEDQMAGNTEFDYLLGISALDSGKPDKATLAFERVLATDPNFAGARLDMARAYYSLGDLARARTEFELVLTQSPPEDARKTVMRYLTAIENAEKAKLRSLRAYAELLLGHDSNVNNSTSQSTINVPALGNIAFTLNPTSLRTPDSFTALGAGAEYTQHLSPSLGVFVGGDWRKRGHSKSDTFDFSSQDFRAGALLGGTNNQLRITGSTGRYYLNAAMNRTTDGLGGDWRYTLDPSTQFNVFSQYNRLRFTDATVQVNSFNSVTSGIGGMHLINEGRAAVFGAIFFGNERDTDGRADGPKRFVGMRLGGQLKLRDDVDMYGSFSTQTGDYMKTNAAFLANRRDDLTDFSVGFNWRFSKDWTLRPQVVHSRNNSNIPIYEFRRTESSITIRRDLNL